MIPATIKVKKKYKSTLFLMNVYFLTMNCRNQKYKKGKQHQVFLLNHHLS